VPALNDNEARILVVDDEEPIRKLLKSHLSELGFEVQLAANGREAIGIIEEQPVDVVLTDIRMPVMTGMELLEAIAKRRDEIAVVLLSACDDVPLAVKALKSGAIDYLLKPVSLDQVSDAVNRAFAEQKRVIAEKLAAFDTAAQVGNLSEQLKKASAETLELLVAVLDARESETMYHSKRVSETAVHLGRVMGLTGEELDVLRRGALLHDVGKVGLPDAILRKPGELTEEERAEMRRHPQIGYRVLQSVESLRPAAEIVLAHHANFDGSGYPVSWKGERIPMGARIFSVVDTFDAMTSDRPYRRALPYEEARAEITRCAGTQFDPKVVAAFESVPRETWDEIRARVAGA
jgi:putative nucleotidyltransferase with HDIG domain